MLDKIIQSLYEDKVAGKLSEERYMKMSENYETEQRLLTDKVSVLKADITYFIIQFTLRSLLIVAGDT